MLCAGRLPGELSNKRPEPEVERQLCLSSR